MSARLVGINHVALEVGDVDEALAFYGRLFAFGLRGRVPGSGHLRFTDPWGNHVEVVDYREVQFTKTAGALRKLGAGYLAKSEAALAEIRERGLGPDASDGT